MDNTEKVKEVSSCLLTCLMAKRSQHVNATHHNIVGRNMLRAFDHLVVQCCDMLSVLAQI